MKSWFVTDRYRWVFPCVLLCALGSAPAAADLIGPASSANLFALGDVTGTALNVQGRTVVGGNGTFRGGNLSEIYAQGDLSLTAVNAGQVQYGGAFRVLASNVGSSRKITTPLYDFAATAEQLRAASTLAANLRVNGAVTTDIYGNQLLSGSDPALNVFEITAPWPNTSVQIDAPSGSMVLVNVDGDFNDLFLTTLNGAFGGRGPFDPTHVLFNFSQATYLSLSSTVVSGSILAPWADTYTSATTVYGSLFADRATLQGSRFYNVPFADHAVPEPSTLLLSGPALLLAGLFGRRRRRRFRHRLGTTPTGRAATSES